MRRKDKRIMGDKLDFKKEYRDIYLPGRQPALIDLPPIRYPRWRDCGTADRIPCPTTGIPGGGPPYSVCRIM